MTTMMMIGDCIHDYEVVDIFPEGGQAHIAQGRHQSSGEVVLIKKLKLSSGEPHFAQELARFQRAGTLLIQHPNVIDPLQMAEHNGEWFTFFPYVECQELGTYVQTQSDHLPLDKVRSIVRDIASGLQAMHDRNIVHRDIKPGNILLRNDGTACIIDLGICRITTEATITTGSGFLGTIPWFPPEQAQDSLVDHRADLYSLGTVLYYLLTRKWPFEGPDAPAVLQRICTEYPAPPNQLNSAVPEMLNHACMRLLDKDPNQRFQSAQELLAFIDGTSSAGAHTCTCGTIVPAGASFCMRCGALLGHKVTSACFACGRSDNQQSECPGCKRSFSPSNHQLEFYAGTLSGRTFRIPEGMYAVGRCDIAPNDYCMSRRQIQIAAVNGVVHVVDTGSTNACLLDGQPIAVLTPLKAGQQIALAGNIATYKTL